VDPEVVAQFNSLQQTGNYIPSGANGSAGTSSTTNSSSGSSSTSSPMLNTSSGSLTTSSGNSAPIQTAVDAFFALTGTLDANLGLLVLSL
jgi:hypothetical protein